MKRDFTTSDEVQDERVAELRAALEEAGAFGIVTWCDDDIIEALENAGADPTPENVAAVRDHPYVLRIADQMIPAGWDVIELTISDLDLRPAAKPPEPSTDEA